MSPAGPVALTGGTGLIGGRLLRELEPRGVEVRVLTRSPERLAPRRGLVPLAWDGVEPSPEALRGAAAVVHLSGEPVFGGRPTAARRRRLWESRVDATRCMVDAVAALPSSERPGVLVCASAVGYYGDAGERELPEDAPPGEGFLADLCVAWEGEARRAAEAGLRVVSTRFGVVLSREGGALAQMAPIFRLGLGGRLGSGRQWFPWVHVDDAAGLLAHALDTPELEGPVNVASPQPVRNADFTRTLGAVLHRPTLLAVPALALKLALGEIAVELLGSKRTVPAAAARSGYAFRRPGLEDALREELGPA